VSRVPFIAPANPQAPTLAAAGEEWTHELKLDGYRVQLHEPGRAVTIYSKNGADFTRRVPGDIATAVLALQNRNQSNP
jgi:bifunctional non-homologous end joining protein LigD